MLKSKFRDLYMVCVFIAFGVSRHCLDSIEMCNFFYLHESMFTHWRAIIDIHVAPNAKVVAITIRLSTKMEGANNAPIKIDINRIY